MRSCRQQGIGGAPGVRSVVELATYQILTEGLSLPAKEHDGCEPGVATHKADNTKEQDENA